MKSLILIATVISSVAFAETAKIEVKGMHCSGCKDMVSKSVCENPEIAKTLESCSVKLTDEKKQMGEINIVTKPDTKLNVDLVKSQVAAAGDDYKVASVDVREMKTADGTAMTPDQVAQAAKPTPNTKTVTTTTTTETETVDANGVATVKKEVKVKKIKTASKTSTSTTKKETK